MAPAEHATLPLPAGLVNLTPLYRYTKPAEIEAAHRKLLQMLERAQADVPRILVVEDDEFHAAFARTVLESAGYLVSVCSAPRHFAEHMATSHPELLLMDVNLPEVSGYDLARLVRQQEQHAALPIIFLTSEMEMESRIRAAKAGGDEHLTKPVHPALLASAVGARLERARFLKSLLHRDGLTRLLTHASFMEQVQQVIDRRSRSAQGPASLVLLDVDHFKQINDTYGHQAGDRVLATLAASLRQHLRRTDIIGRYGGEEFGVLLDQLPIDDAQRLITRLLNEFAALDHSAAEHQHFRVTIAADVGEVGRQHDRRVAGCASWPNCVDVLLGDAQLHGLDAARSLDGLGDAADALGRGAGDGEDGRGLAFGLVDLLLLARLRGLDHLLLRALGGVDGGVALAFGA